MDEPGVVGQKTDVRSTAVGGRSPNFWSRRVAMVATLPFIVDSDHRHAIRITTLLLNDEHDLIQKAVGWMPGKVGKRASLE